MTVLSSLDDIDLMQCTPIVSQMKAKFELLTTYMRSAKLHRYTPPPLTSLTSRRSLLAHILWYVREKTVLHKVLSLWVDRSEFNFLSSDTDGTSDARQKTKFRKVAKVARQWIQRKSSVSGTNSNNRCTTPPELRRASVLLKSSADVTPNLSDTEGTAQDLACINSIRVLQKWLELDQIAHEDIISDLTHLGYQSQVTFLVLKDGNEAIDFLPTLSNIVRVIKAQGSENQQVGKNSFFSSFLSQLISPGELVKTLKVHLSNSRQYDMGSIYPMQPPSSALSASSSSTYVESFKNEITTDDLPLMPPVPQQSSTYSTSKSESTEAKAQPSQTTSSVDQILHPLPSPPSNNGHRTHRPSARDKRHNSHFYTKQSTEATDTMEPHLPTSPRYHLRDGASTTFTNGEKISILTPQDRLTVTTTTPTRATIKLGDLKPSPPSEAPNHIPDSPDSSPAGKGRFVRQNLLRQRSSIHEESHHLPVTNTSDDEVKVGSPRVTVLGGIQFGGYTQPIPPSKVHYPHCRPQSRGRVLGSESENDRESESRPTEVSAELHELQESEGYHLHEDDEDDDDDEQEQLDHLKNVVNQLLDDEESLLVELQSHNATLSQSFPTKRFPSTDPLIPLRGKGGNQSSPFTPTLFPDPNPKIKTSSMPSPSYSMALSQRKEKDHQVLQSLANAESMNFGAVSPNGKSNISPTIRSLRDSNEENRTFFPGIC
jgi:hypothetical protein